MSGGTPAVLRTRWAQAVMIATPILVLMAVLAVRQRAPEHELGGAGAAVVPALRDRAGELERIEIEHAAESVTIAVRDGAWVVVEREDHPARLDRVQELVRSLAALQLEQPMTGLRERHADLGLAWPDERGEARLVRLFLRGAEEPVAEVVLGRDRWSPRAQYVRRLGENQTWRALGAALVEASPMRFVDDGVVRVRGDDLLRIDFPGGSLRPNPDRVWRVVDEADSDAPPLLMAPTPALSDEVREAAEWALPELLFRLDAEDIRRDRGEAAMSEFRYHAIDGTIVIGLIPVAPPEPEAEGQWWMRLRWHPVDAPVTDAEDDATPSPIGDRIAPYAERWSEWLYQIPSWRLGRLLPLIGPQAIGDEDGAVEPE